MTLSSTDPKLSMYAPKSQRIMMRLAKIDIDYGNINYLNFKFSKWVAIPQAVAAVVNYKISRVRRGILMLVLCITEPVEYQSESGGTYHTLAGSRGHYNDEISRLRNRLVGASI